MYDSFKISIGLLFILCTVPSLSVLSQSNFQKGYYINLENDTIYGLIDDRGEVLNSTSCFYKASKNGEIQKFSPEEILSYRFSDGKYYQSKPITIDDKEQQVFLEFLLDGTVNLYFYRDLINYFYLVETKKGDLVKLQDESKPVFVEGKGEMVQRSLRHISLLKGILSDCSEVQSQIDKAELTHKSLIEITKNYHNITCKDEACVIYTKKLPKIKVQFAPLIGYAISNFSFNGSFYSRFNYTPIRNNSFGFQILTTLPRVNERVSLQLDILYMDHNVYGIYNNYYELYIKHSKIQPSLALKYKFPQGKFRPSFALGIASDYLLNPEFKAVVQNIPGSPATEHDLDNVHLTTQLWGGMFQIGCSYHFLKNSELFLNFRFTPTSGATVADRVRTETKVNTINFLIGLKI